MQSSWRPQASQELLKKRARLLQSIRAFFAEREVLEVETPVLSRAAITDPQLESFTSQFRNTEYFLHTSPEFYMKRLLAAGSGDIYQLARVFRVDEQGRNHNPEFTLLEWYRLGFTHQQLMDEIQSLINHVVTQLKHAEKLSFTRLSYQQAFLNTLNIDPLRVTAEDLKQCAIKHSIEIPQGMDVNDKDMWLDWLMVCRIAPGFSKDSFTFLYDYPASQAALARVSEEDARVAHRFELFYGELELGNGFYELTNAAEQLQRFNNENRLREQRGQKVMPVDMDLIAALESGLPDCSGVAIGVDRLLMVLTGASSISEVMGFVTP